METLNCLIETFGRHIDPVRLTCELWRCILMLKLTKMCVNCTNIYCSKNRKMCCLRPTTCQIHPYNTSYKCIDREVTFCSRKNTKLSAQYPGPRMTAILVTADNQSRNWIG
jgi:hypothetical protein